VSVALADHHDELAGSGCRGGPCAGACGSQPAEAGGGVDGSPAARRRAAGPAALPGAPGAAIDFLRDEVAEICGALALGGTLLRRLGLGPEAERLEALFDAVEGRLAECQVLPPCSSASGS
jgi:hypothetical protein